MSKNDLMWLTANVFLAAALPKWAAFVGYFMWLIAILLS